MEKSNNNTRKMKCKYLETIAWDDGLIKVTASDFVCVRYGCSVIIIYDATTFVSPTELNRKEIKEREREREMFA